MSGFQRPDQVDLVMPYRQRYFDDIQRMWETRPIEVSVTFVAGLYPSILAGDELIESTDRYLDDHPTAAPPIKRFLTERRDDVQRTLRCRALDVEAGKREE